VEQKNHTKMKAWSDARARRNGTQTNTGAEANSEHIPGIDTSEQNKPINDWGEQAGKIKDWASRARPQRREIEKNEWARTNSEVLQQQTRNGRQENTVTRGKDKTKQIQNPRAQNEILARSLEPQCTWRRRKTRTGPRANLWQRKQQNGEWTWLSGKCNLCAPGEANFGLEKWAARKLMKGKYLHWKMRISHELLQLNQKSQ
jgi:hypothetical protein